MKKWLKVLAVNSFVLLMVLLVVEIIIRVSGIYYPNSTTEIELGQGDKLLIRSSDSKRVNFVEAKNLVEYNDLGFHDRTAESAANGEGYKIGFFGDSFVEGAQLPTDSLFTSLLADNLKGRAQIFNFGVGGTGTAYQYKLFENYVSHKLDLDYLYLCIFLGNDIEDSDPNIKSHPNYHWIVKGNSVVQVNKKDYSFFQSLVRFCRGGSALLNFTYDKLYRFRRIQSSKKSDNHNHQTGESSTPQVEKGISLQDSTYIFNLASLMSDWRREFGADRFSVMIIDENRYADRPKCKYLLESLDSLGIRQIPLNMTNDESTHYLDGLGHYNARGHEIWAEVAENDILKSVLSAK